MLTQRNGAALAGHPNIRTTAPAAVLPPIIHQGNGNVKVASAKQVEELLTMIWGEPAFLIDCWVGGRGPQYYARSEGHWIPVEVDALGFTLLVAKEQADYDPHFSLQSAMKVGVA